MKLIQLWGAVAAVILSACVGKPSQQVQVGNYIVCDGATFALSTTTAQAVVEFLGREPLVLAASSLGQANQSYTNGRHTVLVNSETGEVFYARGRMVPRSCQRTDDYTVLVATVETSVIADISAKPIGDWSRFLFDFMPAINLCLQETSGELPRVLVAWPMNHGYIGMRLVNQDGGRTECLSDAVNVEQELLPFEAASLPGAGQPYYTPIWSASPFHPDFRHERVERDGVLYGWLSYRE